MKYGKLRVALIGAGQIAEVTHLPVLSQMNDRVELVGIADPAVERAVMLSSRFGIDNTFGDYNEMLSSLNPDAVFVCTPNKFHSSATVSALRSGSHVFCEKPPAINAREVQEMMVASKEAGKILSFNFHYRFRSEAIAIKKFVDSGDLGEIYFCEATALRRRGIPGWGSFTNKEIQGGGPLVDIGVHMLDLALHMMKFPQPKSVTASAYCKIAKRNGVGLMGGWDPEKYSVEDSAFGFVRFHNGASLILKTSFALNMKDRSIMNLQIFGDRGGATIFPPEIFAESHGELTNTAIPYAESKDCYKRSVESFIDSCLGEESTIPTPEEALAVQSIVDAFYLSAESDSTIEL